MQTLSLQSPSKVSKGISMIPGKGKKQLLPSRAVRAVPKPVIPWPGIISSMVYLALGVTLFAGKETGENLDRVPLEYVENAIAWLKEQGFEKIAVDGISKGSEYALLAASRFDDISCVIARVPSYFVSEGMIGRSGPIGDFLLVISWGGTELYTIHNT